MRLSQAIKHVDDEKELVIPFGDESITILYSRRKYTPKFEKILKSTNDEGLPAESLSMFITGIVLSWDIIQDNSDEKVPITVEGLSEVPVIVQQKIVEAIAEDQRPNQKKSVNTSDF